MRLKRRITETSKAFSRAELSTTVFTVTPLLPSIGSLLDGMLLPINTAGLSERPVVDVACAGCAKSFTCCTSHLEIGFTGPRRSILRGNKGLVGLYGLVRRPLPLDCSKVQAQLEASPVTRALSTQCFSWTSSPRGAQRGWPQDGARVS